jgi:hypothetical protein
MTAIIVGAAGLGGGIICAAFRAARERVVFGNCRPIEPYTSTCPTHGGFCYGPPLHRSCPL